jgi:riboflavin synthase
MFTGIIEGLGEVVEITSLGEASQVRYTAPFAKELSVDDSVSINGVCQTVIACDSESFVTQLVEETLRKTNFGSLKVGDKVNLERSLTLQHRLDGHIVQGHVDAVAKVLKIEQEETGWLYTISIPEPFQAYVVGRGSVAVNGISLTVARDQVSSFVVAIIPFTYEYTNMHALREGDTVNIEFDILGKYVLKHLQIRGK